MSYGRYTPSQVMVTSELLTDEVLLSFLIKKENYFDKIALQWMKQYM